MDVPVFDTFADVVVFGVYVFGTSMEARIFQKSESGLVIGKKRSGTRLRQPDFSSKHAEPHGLTTCFSGGDVFSIAGRLCDRFLLLGRPRDNATTE
jgi:hypothetical protein